jgi:NAD(P)-dependent dehydrogenase (short-subunit alcohol dehydrogenase family)
VRLHGLESAVKARNIGLSDRTEKKMMFHYPRATVCDAFRLSSQQCRQQSPQHGFREGDRGRTRQPLQRSLQRCLFPEPEAPSAHQGRWTDCQCMAYGSLKAAVETLTKYMAKELGPRRIAVNVVAPGATETDFSGGIVRDNPAVKKRVAEGTALG